MTQQRGRKKQTLFQLIRDFERKKMADAEPAIVQMFDASGDSEAICEFETYKKVFTRGETYFYKSPGGKLPLYSTSVKVLNSVADPPREDFAHNGGGAATRESDENYVDPAPGWFDANLTPE